MQINQKQPAEVAMVPINPAVIKTPGGLVMVWGHEHVSAKMLDVLRIILSHDAFDGTVYHGVKSVVFRIDGYPKELDKSICASFAPDTGGIAINMEKTLEKTIERSMDHPETSLLTSWWAEMILNFGHEVHHGAIWETERNTLYGNAEALSEEEEKAEKECQALIGDLAKEYNIEMPDIEEEIWFNNQIMELFDGKEETDTWAKAQKRMLIEKIVWKWEPKDSAPVVLSTFKDFICLTTDGDETSEEWNKPTIPQEPNSPNLDEQLNGKKVTMNAAGEQGEVVQPSPAPTTSDPTSEIYIEEMEGYYDGAYEEGIEEYDEPITQPATPAPPTVTTADAAQPAANAFNFFNTPSQQPAQAEEQTGVDMDTVNRIAKQVYMKMYNFIFTNCGQLKESDVGFTNPEAVLTTSLPLTAEEAEIFVSMNHLDINGRWCPGVSTKNGLLGKVMKNTKLPSYEVTLNINGTTHRRLFIPQNPNKRKNGVLTQRSVQARAGDAIAYTKNADTDNWGPYIINGEYNVPRSNR